EMEITRVPWAERGWSAALRDLRYKARSWRGQWVLLQYTALAWSARGFPMKFLRVVKVLHTAETRVGVVYHDVEPFGGERLIDKVRRSAQLRTMRKALRICDLAVLTVPTEKLSWRTHQQWKSVFIPVGANLAVVGENSSKAKDSRNRP